MKGRERQSQRELEIERYSRHERMSRHHHLFHEHRYHRMHHFRHRRRLQRLLFWGFGAAILTTFCVTGVAFAVMRRLYAPGPWMPIFLMFVVGNVVWGFSGLVARRIAQPLRELARVAHELGAGRLDQRVTIYRGAYEIRELARAFNEMAHRIESQVKSQKELLGAVSHELRTPLARLRVLVGSLSEREGDEKLAAHMEREIVELDALVGELLAGARVDAGALQRRALDVADTLQVCVERSGLPQTVVRIEPGAERVDADATLLARAVMVLLDNVKKHGGERIWVVVESLGNELVQFRVEDDGAGFDAEDLPRLFSPFARGRGETPNEHHGLGLGLYLVRRIAEAHGGEVFARNRGEGGASVGFTLAALARADNGDVSTS
jgi:signal transduction histidine kinase